MVPNDRPVGLVLVGATPLTIPFWKTEALGNDFVLVHSEAVEGCDLDLLAQRLCNRHMGVGSDGLLVLGKDFRLRMFNPDGTEDFCGNGLRCAAWHVRLQGWAGDSFTLVHRGVLVPAKVAPDGMVSVELGRAEFNAAAVPLNAETHPAEMWMESFFGHVATAVSTGSTHLILLVDQLPEDSTFFALSPQIEVDSFFPDRTSVIWVKRDGSLAATIRIWERGAGETLACGTGNVAVASVLTRLDGTGGTYMIHNPGGTAKVSINADLTHPVISSPVRQVFEGRLGTATL